ncbi:hypothetical protein [Nitrososphaera sp. AFS]|jgi:hypothetical protein|nr:hypothetical protein [Nitrososphaera sp. AFS]
MTENKNQIKCAMRGKVIIDKDQERRIVEVTDGKKSNQTFLDKIPKWSEE